jgi:hypothetical protein
MRSDSSSRARATAPLAYRISESSTAAEIAAACGDIWLELEGVLSPIIGARGLTALGQRSLHLVSAQFPWLAARWPVGTAALDSALLVSLLAPRSSDDAAAAGAAFFETFHELLASLIGASLTERLLRTVWGPSDVPSTRSTPQDPTP